MKQKIFILSLLIILIGTAFLFGCGSVNRTTSDLPGLKFISSFENGNLYQTSSSANGLYVVGLNGSFHEMGRQYGDLTKEIIPGLYRVGLDYLTAEGYTYDQISAESEAGYQLQYDYMKDLIDGMAETSGLTLEKQKIVANMMGSLFGCSGLAAWGDYTTDRSVVFGRNWDTVRGPFTSLSKYVSIVVYNPSGYNHSVVDINYLGSISPQTCFNDAGLFLDLQNGQMSDPTTNPDVKPTCFQLFSFMLNDGSLDSLANDFANASTNMGLIINAADNQNALSYEWAISGGKSRGADLPGILAATNHFVDPRWTDLPPINAGLAGAFTLERRANLLALGNSDKGSIDPQKMMEIFDTTIPTGGATFPDNIVLQTYYQIVAKPSDKTLWVKSRGYSGWEKVDLKLLFQ